MQTLTLDQLRTATESGGLAGVTLQAQDGDFYLRITTRNGEAVLAKARSTEPRAFNNPLQIITLLRKLGIMLGSFDLSHWNPAQKAIGRSRPDRAAAMKHVHEAVEHDKWFRAQVERGLDEADDPTTAWVPHDVIKQDMAEQRASLLARIKDVAE